MTSVRRWCGRSPSSVVGDYVHDSPPEDGSLRNLVSRSDHLLATSDHLRAQSTAARARLRTEPDREATPPRPTAAADGHAEQQGRRCHVLIVNADPVFLDAARVLLHHHDDHVTTTNLVPHTYDMLHASRADVAVFDLTRDDPPMWRLIARMQNTPAVQTMPIV